MSCRLPSPTSPSKHAWVFAVVILHVLHSAGKLLVPSVWYTRFKRCACVHRVFRHPPLSVPCSMPLQHDILCHLHGCTLFASLSSLLLHPHAAVKGATSEDFIISQAIGHTRGVFSQCFVHQYLINVQSSSLQVFGRQLLQSGRWIRSLAM